MMFHRTVSRELEEITYSAQPMKEEGMKTETAMESEAVKGKSGVVKVPWYTHSARWAPMLKRG